MKQPWLIQRCKQKEQIESGKTFGECFSLDYMGSSEFEDGSVGRTLFNLFNEMDDAKSSKVSIGEKDFYLYGKESVTKEYHTVLKDLVLGKIRTKEYVFDNSTTLWLDLDNNVCFTTIEGITDKLHLCLEASAKKIQRNREVQRQSQELGLGFKLSKAMKGVVALVACDIDDSEGTRILKNRTEYNFVYWLNGPSKGSWVCGFFTVEDIDEFIAKRTGAILEKIQEVGIEDCIQPLD